MNTEFQQAIQTINANFAAWSQAGGMQKLALDQAQNFIKLALAESSYVERLEPSIPAMDSELQRDVSDDEPRILIDLWNPNDHYASFIPFEADAGSQPFRSQKFLAKFSKIESDEITLRRSQLITYPKPITELLKEKIINAMVRKIDSAAVTGFEACVNFIDAGSSDPNINTARKVTLVDGVDPFDRIAWMRGVNKIDGNELKATKALMHKVKWNEWLTQSASDVSDNIAQQMVSDDFSPETSKMPHGIAPITTVKKVFPTNRIYFFAQSQYWAVHRTLGDLYFYIKEEKDIITMGAYQYRLFAIPNVFSLSCVEWV